MARIDPEKDKEYRKKYQQTERYKKWRSEWGRKWRAKNPQSYKAAIKKWRDNNPDKVRETTRKYLRAYTKKLRLELIERFGGKCICCGERNTGFLSIDHINGDGREHRKAFHGSTRELYRDLAKKGGTKRFKVQILCFNCNMGRQFYGGINKICPHKLI